MASARKKQDEKNLKSLRELAALQYNRYCFDCNQRGPTYVNVTIGSFICTKCSGILRGLTPPHRVKSISMATFTTDEIELLKNRGNSYCRLTWLGLYDGNISEAPDEQTVRDLMIDKYERKRFYLEAPADAQPPIQSKTNAVPVVNTFVVECRPNEIIPRQHKKVPEFVADFGSANIYNATNDCKDSNMNENIKPFASFDSNNVNNNDNSSSWNFTDFNATFDQTPVSQSNTNNVHVNFTPVSSPPTFSSVDNLVPAAKMEDRYAALKDLDSALKAQPQLDWNLGSNGSTSPSSSLYSSPSDHGSSFGSSQLFPQPEVSKASNPFNTKSLWGDETHQPTTANPFRTNDSNSKINGVTSNFYKSVPFPVNTGSSWVPNPFTLGPSNSSNPFL